jgi:outer membrane protein OmpA-like peptidoglycan-associated protein
MGQPFRATGLALLLLGGLSGQPADAADADLKITVTNGADTQGDVRVQVRPAGQHNGDVVAWGSSGDHLQVPPGKYDVEITYNDGAANKVVWLDGFAISGHIEKTIDVGLPVAALHVAIVNNGKDIGDNGTFEVRAAGNHGGDVIAYARSGGTVRIAAGTYDVDARYQDGAVEKVVWLDHLAISGRTDKTVEIGAQVADVTWHIVSHGQDLGSDAKYQIRPAGNHQGEVVAWGGSGQAARLPAGVYDVDIAFTKGLIDKTVWLDRQTLSGKVDRTTDLELNLVHPILSATLNGVEVGDKARIGIAPAGRQDEIGAVRGDETALLEVGHYDLTATLPGAEGTLRDVTIGGQPRLVVGMSLLRTAELKPSGPPPKECAIEVYGVNFDFDRAVLRPDAEPVLRSVLQLFVSTPAFSAEVGGHTDNVGKPDYNLKLSEARALAVKAWLVAHGVAAGRVTSRGYGDTRPLVPNDSDADRFRNRRVELRRTNCR